MKTHDPVREEGGGRRKEEEEEEEEGQNGKARVILII